MIKRLFLPLVFAAAWLSSSLPSIVWAQVADQAQTVSSCGTPNNTPVVGQTYPITMDTSATLCTAAGGGGGGGAVYGPTAVGSNAAHPPVLMGGTATESATGAMYNWLVNSSGYGTVQGAGTAGTPAGGVISIQGVSGGVAQPVSQATASSLNATVVGTGTFAVQDGASATGGATPASILSANSTNATNVKSSAGTLYHISVQNNSTSALAYIIFFNTSSTPTCTGTPYYGPILIPYVGSTGNNGGGVIEDIAVGLNFSTGISYCITTAVGGTGSVAANAVTGGLGYK